MRSGSFLENVIPAAILRLGCMNVHSRSIVSDSLRPPWTVARQAPQSIEFSRQEFWSGLPFPAPGESS